MSPHRQRTLKAHMPCLLALASTGCGQEADGYVRVFIDTDAPIASAMLTEEGSSPASQPLFEALRATAIDSDGKPVAGTLREVDLAGVKTFPMSFAVEPENPTKQVTLELVLFRKAHKLSSVDPSVVGLASRVSLPAAGDSIAPTAFMLLRTADTGRRLGWGQPIPTGTTVSSDSVRSSWPYARRTLCSGNAAEDEGCIEGGAFWLGDPELRGNTDLEDSDRERLTVISPFFMDRREVTVANFRRYARELSELGNALPPVFSGGTEGNALDDFSTFTEAPLDDADERGKLPVVGVTWATARAYCQVLGKDLPTEAQFEFVASGMGAEWPYAWGNDAPECNNAIMAAAGYGHYANFDGTCRKPGTIGGPSVPGSNPRDAVQLSDGSVISDLAGNVTEWTLDATSQEAERAVESNEVQFDPVRPSSSGMNKTLRVVKGGSWRGRFVEARAGARSGRDPNDANRSLGFRCVRPTVTGK